MKYEFSTGSIHGDPDEVKIYDKKRAAFKNSIGWRLGASDWNEAHYANTLLWFNKEDPFTYMALHPVD